MWAAVYCGMAMTTQARSAVRAEINVTPMVDVLLVLLIVFMAIAPQQSRGMNALLPLEASSESREPLAPVVLQIDQAGQYSVNSHAVAGPALSDVLRQAASRHAEPVLFLQADGRLDFSVVATAIDIAAGAGFGRTALMRQTAVR